MGFLAFLGSRLGMYLMLGALILAFLGGLYYKVHHAGYVEGVAEYKPLYEALDARNKAANAAHEQATAEAVASQQEIINTLGLQLKREAARKPFVVPNHEVPLETRNEIDRACTITNSFVWLRDEPFGAGHSDQPAVSPAPAAGGTPGSAGAAPVTPARAGGDRPSGISATEVALEDRAFIATALETIRVLKWNLAAWQTWYKLNKPVFDLYNAKIEQINAKK